jgi:hypothetical protein
MTGDVAGRLLQPLVIGAWQCPSHGDAGSMSMYGNLVQRKELVELQWTTTFVQCSCCPFS